MSEEKKRPLTEKQRQKLRLSRAYKTVFGTDENRSEVQNLVWEDMKARGFFLTPVHPPSRAIDVNQGLINEGKRRFHLGTIGYIERPFAFELQTETEKPQE